MTHSRPAIRELLESNHLAPRRDLGQNFVADPNTVRRIADLARVGPGDRVVEIGAGLGSLTLALADTGADITAVEVDRGIVPLLRDVVAERANVTVVEADAMDADWSTLLGAGEQAADPGWVLVANLPYNVATPLVCDLLDGVPQIHRMIVMVQREAAERFVASPRTPAYGAVSVKVAYWATGRIVGHVPASVFVPRPNVESSLVEIERRPDLDTMGRPPTRPPSSRSCAPGSASGERCCAARSTASSPPSSSRRPASRPPPRPEELDVFAWCRLADAVATAPAGTP